MSNNIITKEAYAKALKELLRTQPLSKISIRNITDYCNVSRNSFYYHFKDKYELINWIFHSDMLKNVNSFDDPYRFIESFSNVCQVLHKNRAFYLACFKYVGQNSLFEYIQEFYFELWKLNLDSVYSKYGIKLSESELNLMAKLKSHALIGLLSEWISDGMRSNYMVYFEQLKEMLDSDLSYYSILSNQKLIESLNNKNTPKRPVRKVI